MHNNISALKRMFGFLLLATTSTAFLLSIIGLVYLPQASTRVRANTGEIIATTLSTIQITRQSLATANIVLDQTNNSLSVVTTTIQDVSGTLQDTDDLVGNLGNIAGENLPEIIDSTKESLITAQESAQVIEGVLRTLNGLSFLTGVSYNPDIPMPESIGEISSTLDGLSPAFGEMQDNLEILQANLSLVESNVGGLNDSLTEFQASLAETQTLIEDYDLLLGEIESELEAGGERIDNWLRTFSWVAGFFIIWLMVAQVALMMRGWEYIAEK